MTPETTREDEEREKGQWQQRNYYIGANSFLHTDRSHSQNGAVTVRGICCHVAMHGDVAMHLLPYWLVCSSKYTRSCVLVIPLQCTVFVCLPLSLSRFHMLIYEQTDETVIIDAFMEIIVPLSCHRRPVQLQ